jgi:hypothetical protein
MRRGEVGLIGEGSRGRVDCRSGEGPALGLLCKSPVLGLLGRGISVGSGCDVVIGGGVGGRGICAGWSLAFSDGEGGRGILSGLTLTLAVVAVVGLILLATVDLVGPLMDEVEDAMGSLRLTGLNDGNAAFSFTRSRVTAGNVTEVWDSFLAVTGGFGFETTRGFRTAEALGTSGFLGGILARVDFGSCKTLTTVEAETPV